MKEKISRHQINSWLGTAFLVLGAILSCLVFVDRWTDIVVNYPRIWYQTQGFHLLLCVTFFCGGAWLLHSARASEILILPAFTNVTVYSKPNCELCDRALDLLREFGPAIPDVDLVDISNDAELMNEFAESVPVVEIDGVVRFRGIVSRELLQRLIDANLKQSERSGNIETA